ncbi:Arabinosidase A [Aspergillus ellipticus CBS 707.79]|uniref:non-reducing end alpha-L-arabinofuranosidase n=1 Tax=Aspergillus ellipticus CBS 707.79 TaxID=1448320 RepID=A0A319EBJ0_9EURO|nr:Arabinosidase A [Aspergillus ellipticus CBS 707.79]
MVALSTLSGIGALPLLLPLIHQAQGISLTVSTEGGNSSSPLLYGFIFEDINHPGDGGIYGEMLQNNGLQGTSPNLTAWRLDVSKNASGAVGFTNEGYWGIPVDGSEFQSSFWIKGDYSGNITIRLVSNYTGTEYGSATLTPSSNADNFTQNSVKFDTTKAPDGNVLYELTVDGGTAAGSSLYFGYLTLFGQTYKSRENGPNPQLANVLDSVQGSFLRFPGGNNLEGNSPTGRWKWNETIGPLEDRPGREGTWGYYNTDGLGLAEYFYWCEDLGLAPVLGVWDGFALDSGGGTPLTGDALTPYVDDVLKELGYILGSTSTTYGALRAASGQEEPWNLTMVEIGNEDHLGGGCNSYAERFTTFYDAIHAAYPELTLIASTSDTDCLPHNMPVGSWVDYHDYNNADGMVDQFDYFDNFNRSVPIFIGEYSRGTIGWPNMQGSVSEAVFMIGFERNSDLVKMAAYAPVLQLPDLIGLTQSPEMAFATTSYDVQQMFSTNRGDTIREVSSDSAFGPVYWVASSAGSRYQVN